MADLPHRTKKLKKNASFKPLPESLKPDHRRGHRVHLKKAEFDGELLPDHPGANKTRGAKGFYRACNGGVDYHRTISYIPATMNESKADLRSRSESPRRARAARERYWSYRVIHPDSQRNRLHLDFNPKTDHEGNPYHWLRYSLLPSQVPAVTLSKRQLFEEAQQWPRPPRRHKAAAYREKGTANPRRRGEQQLLGASDGWALRSGRRQPRKFEPQGARPGDGYTCLNEARLFDGLLELTAYEDAVVESLGRCDWDMSYWVGSAIDEHTHVEDGGVGALFKNESDVDALFEMAEQKCTLKLAKRRKKLQKQGWDVWEAEDVMSPRREAGWTEVDDDLEEWELEEAA